MHKLIAFRETYTPHLDIDPEVFEEREVIATFDTQEMAEEYVAKSRLKQPKRNTWMSDRPFRSNSLLAYWSFVEIEQVQIEVPPPHNPN